MISLSGFFRAFAPDQSVMVSFVVACYNVETYLDRLLTSVTSQSKANVSFEIIIVDDGSTDHTATIVASWKQRFPDIIRYIYQENSGVSAARNAGLAQARGSWVGFPDGDDFIDARFLKVLTSELRRKHKAAPIAVVAKLVPYIEDLDIFTNSTPLNYRFSKKRCVKNTTDMGRYFIDRVNSALFHKASINDANITFDPKVVPAFEDGHFASRLLLAHPDRSVIFLADAKYFYRKRSDQTSLLDISKQHKGRYLDQLEYGYLPLLRMAMQLRGQVPKFLQTQIIYSMRWRLHPLIGCDQIPTLTPPEQDRFLALTTDVFSYIDTEYLLTCTIPRVTEKLKIGILHRFKNAHRPQPHIYLEDVRAEVNQVIFSYYTAYDYDTSLTVQVNGKDVSFLVVSRDHITFLGGPFCIRTFIMVEASKTDTITIVTSLDNTLCQIKKGSKVIGNELFVASVGAKRGRIRRSAELCLKRITH